MKKHIFLLSFALVLLAGCNTARKVDEGNETEPVPEPFEKQDIGKKEDRKGKREAGAGGLPSRAGRT